MLRPFVCYFLIVVALLHGTADSFITPAPQYTTPSSFPSRITPPSLTQLAASERREVFGLARKVAGVVAASLFTFTKSAKAIVNDNESVNGRIITFTVNNLGGEEGKTGTFKIQTAPSWAPKGVARFEVR